MLNNFCDAVHGDADDRHGRELVLVSDSPEQPELQGQRG